MNKKISTTLLSLFFAISTFAQTWDCGKPTSGSTPTSAVTATLSDGTLTFSGSGAMADFTDDPSPWYSYRESISRVVINNGVTSIGNKVFFDCSRLTSVTIPNNVTTIGNSAFSGCSGLMSVTIPNSVKSIGNSAFSSCSGLMSVTIPNSVTTIGDYAFRSCSGLTSVTIPNSVTSIGNNAFSSCSGLMSVTIPNSVTSIGNNAFSYCSGLTSVNVDAANLYYSSVNGGLFNKTETTLILCPAGKQGGYIIPNSVTTISDYAFSRCSGLTSVTIPNDVTTIGNSAFEYCNGLTSITIPNNVTSIGDEAFFYCSSLTSITIPSSVASIGNRAFSLCSGLKAISVDAEMPPTVASDAFSNLPVGMITLTVPENAIAAYEVADVWKDFHFAGSTSNIVASGYCGGEGDGKNLTWELSFSGVLTISGIGIMTNGYGPWYIYRDVIKSLSIGSDVTTIGEFAFSGCWCLTSVTIPNSVTSIGNCAFESCSSLTSVTIPNDVTTIGPLTFQGCRGLTSVTIPNNVTTIGSSAFSGCSGLTSVTIPNNVISIGSGAFSYCNGLTAINVDAANTYYSSANGVLFNKTETTLIQCPGGKQGGYIIPNSVTSIDHQAFSGCSGLTSVTIPNSVTSIGSSAFSGCSGLTSMTIPNDVTSIGNRAFSECSGLTSITIPNNVTSISNETFSNCSGLTSITIPNSVTTIGYSAFHNCSGLKAIRVDAEMPPTVGTEAFAYLPVGMITLTVPENTIAAYEAADVWKDFHFAGSTSNIAVSGYCGGEGDGKNLTWELSLSGALTISGIGIMTNRSVPWGNYRDVIKSLSIGSDVTTIGNSAFYSCDELTEVTIPNSVTTIGRSAFSYCDKLTAINVDAANTSYASENGVLFNKAKTTIIQYPCGKQGAYVIPASVSTIGYSAFFYCDKLTEVTIPNSVTTIEGMAFYACTALTAATIPSSVTSIVDQALGYCIGLETVNVLWETPLSVSSNLFSQILLSDVVLNVPFGTKTAYAAADVWKDFGSIVERQFSNEEIASILAENNRLRQDTATLRSDTAALANANRKLQSQLATANSDKTTLQSQIAALNAQIADLQTQLTDCRTSKPDPTAVADVETHGRASLQAYPNPTSSRVTVEHADLRAGDAIEVLTTAGKQVASFTATGQTSYINLDELAAGTYILRVARIGATVKVVKQ